MNRSLRSRVYWLLPVTIGFGLVTCISIVLAAESPIDMERARQLLFKERSGQTLTAEEQDYLQRAREARRQGMTGPVRPVGQPLRLEPRPSTGMVPLCDMSADDRYQGEDGGLYGGGRNLPPDEHRRAAQRELAQIQPLDAQGRPAADGRIVLVALSMSNATQEFSRFKQVADADPEKSSRVTIVDCAQGGQAMAEWADPQAPPWNEAARRLNAAGVSPQQVQIAWVKLANKGPQGDLRRHGEKLQRDTQALLQNAQARFPNLRIAYLGSRIYGGYSGGPLNPEPYAYESAFVVRWLIQDQIAGTAALNFDPEKGERKSPLLLWGPYLWADGVQGRKTDDLVWTREDLAGDGTHPSPSGRDKVARLLLDFFKSDPLAESWFLKTDGSPLPDANRGAR
ncbi:MAG: hypothetical protein KJ000_05830 [Pirellulaceae bacterium]|nr:hypothetical protein [Pirellulaceae bacterium]